jgi:hypothetical protein
MIMQRLATIPAPLLPVAARRALALACAGAAVVVVTACTRVEDKPLPADPKARSEFIDAQRAKLTEESRGLLDRFLARVKVQEAAGGAPPTVSISKALELQRVYDSDVAQFQRQYQDRIGAAKADVRVEVRNQSVIKEDLAKSAAGKALRYTVDITNTGKRVIERVALRIEIREAAGTYLAAIPLLELKGPLKPGEAGRTVQTLPLNPNYQAYLIAGHPAQIIGVPVKVVYADGAVIDADAELSKLQSISRRKIE